MSRAARGRAHRATPMILGLGLCQCFFYGQGYNDPVPQLPSTPPEDLPLVVVEPAQCEGPFPERRDLPKYFRDAPMADRCAKYFAHLLTETNALWAVPSDSFEEEFLEADFATDGRVAVSHTAGDGIVAGGWLILLPGLSLGIIPAPYAWAEQNFKFTVQGAEPDSHEYSASAWAGWIPLAISEDEDENKEKRNMQLASSVLEQLPLPRPARSQRLREYLRHVTAVRAQLYQRFAETIGPGTVCAVPRMDYLSHEARARGLGEQAVNLASIAIHLHCGTIDYRSSAKATAMLDAYQALQSAQP